MTLSEMQATATKRTEAIIGAWTKQPTGMIEKSIEAYKKAYEDIDKKLQKVILTLDGVAPENRMNELIKYNRLSNLKKEAKAAYDAAAKINASNQALMSRTAITNKYYGNMYSVNWLTEDYFKYIDQKAVEVSIFGTPEVWDSIKTANAPKYMPYQPQYGTLIDILTKNRTEDILKLNAAITQGLIQGTSYAKVSKEIKSILNTSANKSLRIARTEGNRNLNAGAFANTQAALESGIEMQRQYVATLDTRTREQSGSMDGQTVNADEPFTYPNGVQTMIVGNSGVPRYDINDRCTSIDIIPGFEPTLRRGRDPVTGENEIISYKSFDDWIKEKGLKYNKSGLLVEA